MLIAEEEEEEEEEGGLNPSYASKPSLLGLQQDISFDNRGKKQQQQVLPRELTNVRGRRMSSSVSPSWWAHLLQHPRRKEGRKEVSATTSRVFHHRVVVVVVAPTAAWQAFMLPWWRSRNGRVRSSPPTNAEFDVHEGPAACGASRQGSNLEFLCNSLRGDTRFQGLLQQLDLWGRKRRCKKQAPGHQVLNQKWIVKRKEEAEEDPWITFATVSEALVPNPRRVSRVLTKWICEGEEEEEEEDARISGPSSFKSEMDCEGDLKMEEAPGKWAIEFQIRDRLWRRLEDIKKLQGKKAFNSGTTRRSSKARTRGICKFDTRN